MPEAPTAYVAGVMLFTRNDTWLRTSRLYANQRNGVSILLLEGSGNPGVQENRFYNNEINGIDMEVSGTKAHGDNGDTVFGKPSPWNNFVYNLNTGFVTFQNSGIVGRVRRRNYSSGRPDVELIVGVYHNSVTNQSGAGISVTGNLGPSGLPVEGVWGNNSAFNGGNDIEGVLVNNYNWTLADGDPQFLGASTGDLHIAITSGCIDRSPTSPYYGTTDLSDDIDGLGQRPFDYPGVGPVGGLWDAGADEVH
jgi:hypothetical protein